jgi:PASTA domain
MIGLLAVARRLAPATAVAAAAVICALPATGAAAAAGNAGGGAAGLAGQPGSRPVIAHALPGKPKAVPASGSARSASRWSVSVRKLGRRDAAARHAAPAAPSGRPVPHAVSITGTTVTSNFAGINRHADRFGQAADPNAAANGTQILQTTEGFLEVYNYSGVPQCSGVPLDQFLRDGIDFPEEARIQYDSANGRFNLIAGTMDHGPALYVAVSTTSDPCGTWNVTRLTFSGDLFPAGSDLDFPSLGQDSRALLIGAGDAVGDVVPSYSVFAIPKAALYANATLSFPAFDVGRWYTTPVTNAGNPVIDTTFSYFLSPHATTVDGGYAVYRMDGTGTANPTLTAQALYPAPFIDPAPAPQPGTSTTVDALDGRIPEAPVWDGTRIWFATGINDTLLHPDGPVTTVRYGFIVPRGAQEIEYTLARHSATSADLNPSIGVGLSSSSIESIFLNWVYTDVANGTPLSDTVATFVYDGGSTLPATLAGDDRTLITGAIDTAVVNTPDRSTTMSRFGEFSSVMVDPASANGTCAVTSQTYFLNSDGIWGTNVARICAPAETDVPDVTGETVSAAQAALQAVFLHGDNVTSTTACAPASNGLVVATSPPPATMVPTGSQVTLAQCSLTGTVPDLSNKTQSSATAALRAAGFVLGAVGTAPDGTCVMNGKVVSQSPPAGAVLPLGSPVSITVGVKVKGSCD